MKDSTTYKAIREIATGCVVNKERAIQLLGRLDDPSLGLSDYTTLACRCKNQSRYGWIQPKWATFKTYWPTTAGLLSWFKVLEHHYPDLFDVVNCQVSVKVLDSVKLKPRPHEPA